MNLRKWSQRDLNPRPFDYESIALTNCAMGPGGWYTKKKETRYNNVSYFLIMLCWGLLYVSLHLYNYETKNGQNKQGALLADVKLKV